MSTSTLPGRPPTVSANLRHDCRCGAALTLRGPRPLPDFGWWLQQLAQHQACS